MPALPHLPATHEFVVRDMLSFCPTCSLETIAKANPGKTVLVVTHGGILNSIFKRIVGQDLTSPRRFGITNAAISQVNSNEGPTTHYMYFTHIRCGAVLTLYPLLLPASCATRKAGAGLSRCGTTPAIYRSLGFFTFNNMNGKRLPDRDWPMARPADFFIAHRIYPAMLIKCRLSDV